MLALLESFLFTNVTIPVAIGLGFLLILWIYFSKKTNRIGATLLLSLFFITLCCIFGYFFVSATNADLALFWLKLDFSIIYLFLVNSYFFATYFPQEKKRYAILDRWVVIIGAVFAYVSIFTDFFIKAVQFKDGEPVFLLGDGAGVFYGGIIVFISVIIWMLFDKYFKVSDNDKVKIQYLLIGILTFALISFVLDLFLPFWLGIFKYVQFGSYIAILGGSLIAYILFKKKLVGTNVILTKIFIVSIAVLLFLDAFAFTQDFSLQVLKTIIFIAFLSFGYLLIRSILFEEVKKQERLQKVNQKLIDLTGNLEKEVKKRTKVLEEERATLTIKIRARTKELREVNESLEQRVADRTKKLQEKMDELNKWHELTVGRELKMIELKKKIKRLEKKIQNLSEKV